MEVVDMTWEEKVKVHVEECCRTAENTPAIILNRETKKSGMCYTVSGGKCIGFKQDRGNVFGLSIHNGIPLQRK